MIKLLMIAGGGAVGALLRYGVSAWGQKLSQGSIPIGTLVVNVVGCLVIGLLWAAFSGPILLREEYKVGLLVGVLGAFTTFSTFAWESFALVNDGQRTLAMWNILLHNVSGLGAVWFGFRIGEKWFGV